LAEIDIFNRRFNPAAAKASPVEEFEAKFDEEDRQGN
jgi:hypothetical protein